MSTFSVATAVAHGVLSSSSAWAIWETKNFVFAPFGFLLYFINGILGLIAYAAASTSETTARVQAAMQNAYLPLMAAQVAEVSSSPLCTKMMLVAATAIALVGPSDSPFIDHVRTLSVFVIVFQWDVLSGLWWTYVALVYSAYFLLDAVGPVFTRKFDQMSHNLNSASISAANLCFVVLLKAYEP